LDAAQVSGVYTPPEHRGRGYATRGLAEQCMRLFERSRHVCLFVNDFNAPALALYRRLGFRVIASWASAFYDPAARSTAGEAPRPASAARGGGRRARAQHAHDAVA